MKMKKLLSSVLALALVFVMCGTAWSPASAANFSDVKSSDWFSAAVGWAMANEVTSGKTPTTFAPNDPCKREEVMTFLWRANGSPMVNAESHFTDVRVTNYFFSPVMWAVENGITVGVSDTLFGAGQPCTRAMVVQFLWKNAGSPQTFATTKFSDVTTSDWYYKAVQWAIATGITAGTGNGKFSPNATCTRAQIVQFLYKYTNGATIKQPENFTKAYEPVIINTLKMLKGQSYNAAYVADNPNLKNAVGKAAGVGVSLIDLDQDGTVELLIGDISTIKTTTQNQKFYYYFWVLYTVQNGYAVQVTTSTDQDRHYLCDDGNSASVVRVGTDVNNREFYEEMTFKDHDLYALESLFISDDHYCYSDLGEGVPEDTPDGRRSNWEEATRSNLSQLEFQRMAATMQVDVMKPSYVSITAYQA